MVNIVRPTNLQKPCLVSLHVQQCTNCNVIIDWKLKTIYSNWIMTFGLLDCFSYLKILVIWIKFRFDAWEFDYRDLNLCNLLIVVIEGR